MPCKCLTHASYDSFPWHPSAKNGGVFEKVKAGEIFTYEFTVTHLDKKLVMVTFGFNRDFDDAPWVFEVRGLIVTKDFTEKFSMEPDFVFALIEDNAWSFVTEVGFGYFIASWFQPLIDGACIFENPENEERVFILNITAGFTAHLTEWLTIVIGVNQDIYPKNIENKVILS